jgi:hypothetical protein
MDKDFQKLLRKQKIVSVVHFIFYNLLCIGLFLSFTYMIIGFMATKLIVFLLSAILLAGFLIKYALEYKDCLIFQK